MTIERTLVKKFSNGAVCTMTVSTERWKNYRNGKVIGFSVGLDWDRLPTEMEAQECHNLCVNMRAAYLLQ